MNNCRNSQNLLTRQWLQTALIKLLKQKDLSDITVSELTKTAGVARVTFYRNYTDISDIIFDFIEQSEFGMSGHEQKKLYLPHLIQGYFAFFQEYRELFCVLNGTT